MTTVDTAQVICPVCGGIGQVTAGTACQCCRGVGMCGPNRAAEYERQLATGQLETVRASLAAHAADVALAYRRALAAARRCEYLLSVMEETVARDAEARAPLAAALAAVPAVHPLAAGHPFAAILPPLPPGHPPTVPGQGAKDPLLQIDSILVRELDVWGPLNAPNFQPVTGLQPSGDVTGVTDTGAITAALAAGNTTLAPGTFYVNTAILVPPHLQFEGSGPLTRIFFVGSGDCFQVYGGAKPVGFSNIPAVSLAGRIANMTIDGSLSSSSLPSTGLHIGSGIGFSVDDVFVTNFAGTPNSFGIHLDNNGQVSPAPWYTEKAHIRAYTANCGIHVLIDAANASQPSFEYDDLTFYLLWVEAFQSGVVIKDGAYMAGASLTIRGNFDTNNQTVNGVVLAASNTGILANIATWANPAPGVLAATGQSSGLPPGLAYVFTGAVAGLISYTGSSSTTFTGCQYIGGTTAASTVSTGASVQPGGSCLAIISQPVAANNVSFLQDVTIDIGVEANNNKSFGPNTVFFGQNQTGGGNSPNQLINCSGRMAFRLSPWSLSNGAPGGQVSLAGPIRNDSVLASANTQIVNGNLDVATPGQGLQVKEGSNCKQGVAALVGGTVTVANTSVTASSRINVWRSQLGGTPGHLSTTQTAGTGFTVNSSSGTDTSNIGYQIFEPG